MADYIRYANQGAKRNLPLDPELVDKLKYLQDMGLTAEVFSGGQVDAAAARRGEGRRTGSVRHDDGGAGDMRFYRGDRRLDYNNPQDLPIFREIVSRGKAAGITGFGAGQGYMEPGSMHVGMGNPGVWGKAGKGYNAAAWLREAYNGTSAGSTPIDATQQNVMAQVQNKQIDPVQEVLQAATTAKAGGTPGAEAATAVASAAQEPTFGDKIGKALFGDKLAADLKGSFGPDAKPNSMQNGLGLFAGALGMGGSQKQAPQQMSIDPTSLGAVEAADAQRAAGATQLMAALLANRRRV